MSGPSSPRENPEVVVNHAGQRFFLRSNSCPTCAQSRARPLGVRGGRSHRYGLGAESQVFQCRGCSLIFTDPMPIPLDPSEIYGDAADYFEFHDSSAKLASARELVSQIIARSDRPSPRILDIGSGQGEVLRAAMDAGLDAVGLELSEPFIERARAVYGVEVEHATVEEYALRNPDAEFDAVVAYAVLEHVYDPDAFVSAVSSLLRKGGLLRIDVPREPNIVSSTATLLARLRFQKTTYHLAPTWEPFHLYGFSPKALKALLSKHGLRIDELRVHARPVIPADGGPIDKARALAGASLIWVGNRTGHAPNMDAWSRKVSP